MLSSQRAPVGFPFLFTQTTKWARMLLANAEVWPHIGQMFVLLLLSSPIVRGRVFRAFSGFCPGGIFDGMTTPLTCDSLQLNVATMVNESLSRVKCCLLIDGL